MNIDTPRKIRVGTVPHKGRGVFAVEIIAAGEIIEQCPVLLFDNADHARFIDNTPLECYYFRWTDSANAILLGFGSLYNHSFSPNAEYVRNYEKQVMEFRAIKPITPGEEILVNYNGRPDCKEPVWFQCEESA